MVTGKNIRTEIAASDAVISRELNSRPPVGVDQDFVGQPVRDQLLLDGGTWSAELPESGGELGLASHFRDCSFQGGNVVFLHRWSRLYTRNLVHVNKSACFTADKGSCTVLIMPTAKKKPHKTSLQREATKRKAEPMVGPDGFTMGQRVLQLMDEQDNMSQTELAKACSRLLDTFIPGEPDRVKQQHIFNIVQLGQDSSWVVALIAKVFEVDATWLQFGFGKRSPKPN